MPITSKIKSAQWIRFLGQSLQARIPPARFGDLVKALHRKVPLQGCDIAKILVTSPALLAVDLDPLGPLYIDRLLGLGLLEGHDILLAVQERYDSVQEECAKYGRSEMVSAQLMELEEAILIILFRAYTGGTRPHSGREIQKTLGVLADRISAMAAKNAQVMMDSDIFQQAGQQELFLREAFGMLLVAMLKSPKVEKLLDSALSPSE